MKQLASVLFLLGLSACTKCTSSSAVDAAPRVVVRPSIDLRTAVTWAYPEYRDTAVLEVVGRVTREVPGLTDKARDEALQSLHYEPAEDGGWRLSNFHLEQLGPETLSVSLSYNPDQLAHLYVAATALTSMELAMYLPRSLPLGREVFTFTVRYVSAPKRAHDLVVQATSLLVANGQWSAQTSLDAGTDERDHVVLLGPDQATLTFHRDAGQVQVVYALETVKGP